MLHALNGEKVYWVAGTAIAATMPAISLDLSMAVNSLITILLATVAFFLRGWYVAVQQHLTDSEKRFDRIERRLARLGMSVTPNADDHDEDEEAAAS